MVEATGTSIGKEVDGMFKVHLRYVRYVLTALSTIGFAAASHSQ